MRIGGPIPIHVARAYGIAKPGCARPLSRAPEATPAREPIAAPATPTTPATATTPTAAPESDRIDRLLGGAVPGPAAPDGEAAYAPPRRAGDAFQLYTRAADRIEAAVAVRIGRSIDVKG